MLEILGISKWVITVISTVQMVVMMDSCYYWGTLNSRYATRTLLLWTLPVTSLSCLLWTGIEILQSYGVSFMVGAAMLIMAR